MTDAEIEQLLADAPSTAPGTEGWYTADHIGDCHVALRELLERAKQAEAVVVAAKAEVVALGYRSTDMAEALKAVSGEYWFEEWVPECPEPCGWTITTEMDDGPLKQRCVLRSHGPETEHRYAAAHERVVTQREDGR